MMTSSVVDAIKLSCYVNILQCLYYFMLFREIIRVIAIMTPRIRWRDFLHIASEHF